MRRHKGHRHLQVAQVLGELRQMVFDELLRHLPVDRVADHRLDVVIGQDLLNNVGE